MATPVLAEMYIDYLRTIGQPGGVTCSSTPILDAYRAVPTPTTMLQIGSSDSLALEIDSENHERDTDGMVERYAEAAYKDFGQQIDRAIKEERDMTFWVFPFVSGCTYPIKAFNRVVHMINDSLGHYFRVLCNTERMHLRLELR